MPWLPGKSCGVQNCSRIARAGKYYCDVHLKEYEKKWGKPRAKTAERGYGGKWQRLRKKVLERDKICMSCGNAIAVEVHHVVAKRYGGGDEMENLVGLCKKCHSRITAYE